MCGHVCVAYTQRRALSGLPTLHRGDCGAGLFILYYLFMSWFMFSAVALAAFDCLRLYLHPQVRIRGLHALCRTREVCNAIRRSCATQDNACAVHCRVVATAFPSPPLLHVPLQYSLLHCLATATAPPLPGQPTKC